MGMRKNKTIRETQDLNPELAKRAEELPPLEFKGKRDSPLKGKNRKRRPKNG